jgi:catalase
VLDPLACTIAMRWNKFVLSRFHFRAPELSRSALFDGDRIEVIGRFSIAGGDPSVSDSGRNPHGMALEFRLKGGHLHHITMIHKPMFFARTPSTSLLTDAQLAQTAQIFLRRPSETVWNNAQFAGR